MVNGALLPSVVKGAARMFDERHPATGKITRQEELFHTCSPGPSVMFTASQTAS
jgi:hypothetical protein